MTFAWGYEGFYVGNLSKLCHKCVTEIQKRLNASVSSNKQI